MRYFGARRVRPRVAQRVVDAVPSLVILGAGWAHRNLVEDAFIYLRVAKQLEAGHGPVFNAGQRVEAFTGTIWLFMLTLADVVTPVRFEWLAVALGLACAALGVFLAVVGSQRLWSLDQTTSRRWFLPAGALVFVALLPVWVYSGSGLENGLVTLWLGLVVLILGRWAGSSDLALSTGGAVVLGLGWLIRPELVLYSAGFFVVVLALTSSRRDRVRIAVAMVALPLAYQVFRMGYFGSLVPNTAIAKEGSSANWSRGTRYVRDFVGPYWLWIPISALVVGAYVPLLKALRGRSRGVATVVAFVGAAGVEVLYVALVGGDYLHARLLLPSLFALVAPVAAIPIARRQAVALLVVPWALIAMITLKPDQYRDGNYLAHGFQVPLPQSYGGVTVEDNGWGLHGTSRQWYSGPGFYTIRDFVRHVRVDPPLRADVPLPYGMFWGVGVSAYAMGTGFTVLDLMGLADPLAAHLEPTPSQVPRFAGHEKPLPQVWSAALVTRPGSRPDPLDFPNIEKPLIPETTGSEFQRQVAWARGALRCGGLARVLAAADAPMTPRRFVSNFLHAFANTRTRVPPDPERAYHRFCGPGVPAEVRRITRSGH